MTRVPRRAGRPPTIIDVARRAQVSKSTVSNVLQGKVHVEPPTRDRVLKAIEDLGYHTNAGARYMRQKSHVLGVVVGDLRNPFHAEMAALIEEHAATRQHSILLATTGGLAQREAARVQNLVEHRVAAIIFVAFSGGHAVLAGVPSGVPRIFVSFTARGGTSIAVDERLGARLAVEHLLELGHESIAYASTTLEDEPKTDTARFTGFRRVLAAHGAGFDERHVVRVRRGGTSREDARVALASLLTKKRRPTAVFAASDFTALEIMEVADARGLEIPRDLSVVGFDDIELARLSRIRLTTVAQPMEDMAELSVAAAIDGHGDFLPESRDVRLPPRLVVRGSTAKAPTR